MSCQDLIITSAKMLEPKTNAIFSDPTSIYHFEAVVTATQKLVHR